MNKSNYYISVSEPWDFESRDGKNIIKGTVLKIVNENCVIFKSKTAIEIEKNIGDTFVLFSRHYDNNFNTIDDKKFWTVNVGMLSSNSYEAKDKIWLEQNSKFVIIGSLKKN